MLLPKVVAFCWQDPLACHQMGASAGASNFTDRRAHATCTKTSVQCHTRLPLTGRYNNQQTVLTRASSPEIAKPQALNAKSGPGKTSGEILPFPRRKAEDAMTRATLSDLRPTGRQSGPEDCTARSKCKPYCQYHVPQIWLQIIISACIYIYIHTHAHTKVSP